LLNIRYGSLLGPRGLLLIYMWGENSNKENPVIHLPAFRPAWEYIKLKKGAIEEIKEKKVKIKVKELKLKP
jgi:hypothetical protein